MRDDFSSQHWQGRCGGLFSWVKGNHGSFPVFHTFRKKCSPKNLRQILKITSKKPCLKGAHPFQDSFSISIKMVFRSTPSLFDVFFCRMSRSNYSKTFFEAGWKFPGRQVWKWASSLRPYETAWRGVAISFKTMACELTSDDGDTKNPVVRKKRRCILPNKTVSSHVFLKGISLLTIEGRGEFLSKLFKKIPLFLVMFDSKGGSLNY